MICKPLIEGKSFSLYENDDSVIPARLASGIEKEDACNYIVSGCWDALTPDASNKFSGEYLNILKPFEWSIHREDELMAENELYCEPIDGAKNFEEVYALYKSFVKKLLLRKAEPMSRASRLWHTVNPTAALSALMQTCITKRLDLTNGGGKYNRECVYLCGFAEVIDSLLAIKKLCFEDGVCSLGELLDACRSNWSDEILRQRVISAPSYGDGSEESSLMAKRLFDDLYEMTRGLPTAYGGEFRMGFNQYTEIIWWGKKTKALPNGRCDGEYLSQGITPSRYQNHINAVDILDSLRYMDLTKCAGNSSMAITLPVGGLDTERLSAFFRAAARSGIQAMQPNCVDIDTLLKAQKDPENYSHIIVRVCGFSAPFVLLSPTYQTEFISRMRTEI